MSMLKKEQLAAADEFVGAAIELLRDDQGVHAETAVAGTARMAGTFLFRSFGFPAGGIVPGQAVLSDKANESGPPLIQLLGAVVSELGVPVDPSKVSADPANGPRPNLAFLDTQRRLEPRFAEIRSRLGLSHAEAAQSAAVAAGILIEKTAQVLDPTAAFGIAVYGFIEGSKTAPDPVAL